MFLVPGFCRLVCSSVRPCSPHLVSLHSPLLTSLRVKRGERKCNGSEPRWMKSDGSGETEWENDGDRMRETKWRKWQVTWHPIPFPYCLRHSFSINYIPVLSVGSGLHYGPTVLSSIRAGFSVLYRFLLSVSHHIRPVSHPRPPCSLRSPRFPCSALNLGSLRSPAAATRCTERRVNDNERDSTGAAGRE